MFATDGCEIVDWGRGGRNADYSATFRGEDHRWHEVAEHEIRGTFFSRLSLRFDGWGRDDSGNAQLEGVLEIPVLLEAQ